MRPLVLILAAGLALGACGEAPRPAAEPRVTIKLDGPDDGRLIRAEQIQVTGTVTPADAAVRVAGTDAPVEGGAFRVTVALQPGGNVIDVMASAPGRRAAVDALRIMRDMRVKVPPVLKLEVRAATAQLKTLGLQVSEDNGDSWLDRVLGGEVDVCASHPAAGALVQPHSTVTLDTSQACG